MRSEAAISGYEAGRSLEMAGLCGGVGGSEVSNASESFINLNAHRGGPGPGPPPDGGAICGGEREASAVTVREVPVELVIKELVGRNSVTEPAQTDDAAHQETWGEEMLAGARLSRRWRDRD